MSSGLVVIGVAVMGYILFGLVIRWLVWRSMKTTCKNCGCDVPEHRLPAGWIHGHRVCMKCWKLPIETFSGWTPIDRYDAVRTLERNDAQEEAR